MDNMPLISACEVLQCFYNRDNVCHAPAINVGGSHPVCDTFVAQREHIHRDAAGAVGACHVSQCRWNSDLTCAAASIAVSLHNDHPDCSTFAPSA
jgi:hypothetical protein